MLVRVTVSETNPGPQRETRRSVVDEQLPRLHQPRRVFIALAEVLVAGLLVWAAFMCWDRVVSTVTVVLSDGAALTSTRYAGNWVAGAIAMALIAALLLVDAVRQTLLAMYARHRRPGKRAANDEQWGYPEVYGA